MEILLKRKTNTMSYDKVFEGELCHATGYDVILWEPFDSKGVLHYDR